MDNRLDMGRVSHEKEPLRWGTLFSIGRTINSYLCTEAKLKQFFSFRVVTEKFFNENSKISLLRLNLLIVKN